MLSLLPQPIAISANIAAALAAPVELHPPSKNCFLDRLLRHRRVTSHAISLGTTSHKPSLASIKNSSLSVRPVTTTSGWEITKGFR